MKKQNAQPNFRLVQISNLRAIALALALASALILVTACQPQSSLESAPSENASAGDPGLIEPTPTPENRLAASALWEAARSGTHPWSLHSFKVVETYGPALLRGAKDIKSYCPAYFNLTQDQKITFWVHLVSAMAKFESGFDPTTRMKETTLGIDPITDKPVYSEGLLQLSYQDERSYPFCNEFDWDKDRLLSPTDPRKTILDPFKNLSCGIRILNWQINRNDEIGFTSGNYWAVLRTNGRYSKVPEIKALTNKLSFCQN